MVRHSRKPMSKRIDEVTQDLKEIKRILVDNTIKLAEYNAQLDIHIRATRNLEARIRPVEDHVLFLRKLMRLMTWVVGIVVALVTVHYRLPR
jgi:hypothetical protein